MLKKLRFLNTINRSSDSPENLTDADSNDKNSEREDCLEELSTADEQVSDNERSQETDFSTATEIYNDAYHRFESQGVGLYQERRRSVDLLTFVEALINSISKTPKSLDKELHKVAKNHEYFKEIESKGKSLIQDASSSMLYAGIGIGGGSFIAGAGPSAAIWVATTFGTASTGTAISSLGGAAASNAALAWLGGGTLAGGGMGAAGGASLLAMAGPIGIAVVTIGVSATGYSIWKKRKKQKAELKVNTLEILKNASELEKTILEINRLRTKTTALRDEVATLFIKCMGMAHRDYDSLSEEDSKHLASLVNTSFALSGLINVQIDG
ncbi:hypothetical protein BSR29_05300 [Boudabousia liubingyangii]|uniref:Uncharacterized protein n=1 Tax=Boudabousia liubingyangii TaxID=1921764 RepID=A0A1Q5PLH0_9ACTO|nr:hypothetical protein [Boudabousia liubingyangii]OKL47902.1 hypothetical protein BSR29_05300 [Boudabousia liubingyangii]